MQLTTHEKKLDELLEKIGTLKGDPELQSDLSKYFCVLVSGYVESSVKDFVEHFHKNACPKETERYVGTKISRLTNLDYDKLQEFLRSFSDDWCNKVDAGKTDQIESALNTVYSQRNLIAHGKSFNSNITYKAMNGYYTEVKNLLKLLKRTLKKGH